MVESNDGYDIYDLTKEDMADIVKAALALAKEKNARKRSSVLANRRTGERRFTGSLKEWALIEAVKKAGLL